MLFGATPFYERGIDQKGLFKNIVRGKWTLPDDKLSRHARDLISGMLHKRPTERLGKWLCLIMSNRSLYSPQVNILPPSVFLFPYAQGV